MILKQTIGNKEGKITKKTAEQANVEGYNVATENIAHALKHAATPEEALAAINMIKAFGIHTLVQLADNLGAGFNSSTEKTEAHEKARAFLDTFYLEMNKEFEEIIKRAQKVTRFTK